MNTLETLIDYAKRFIGKPYLFGGDDPVYGFDCSGLACELLRLTGLVPYNFRANAQGIHDFLIKLPGIHQFPSPSGAGSFVFFGKDLKSIVHVGFCIGGNFMVEAGGGDSTTTSEEVASKRNAFVKIRRVSYRKDFLVSVLPEYS